MGQVRVDAGSIRNCVAGNVTRTYEKDEHQEEVIQPSTDLERLEHTRREERTELTISEVAFRLPESTVVNRIDGLECLDACEIPNLREIPHKGFLK